MLNCYTLFTFLTYLLTYLLTLVSNLNFLSLIVCELNAGIATDRQTHRQSNGGRQSLRDLHRRSNNEDELRGD